MAIPRAEVIEFNSRSGLILQGLLFGDAPRAPVVIHVHGACGNFLSFSPILREASILGERGINLFSINTSGCDCIREGFRNSTYGYIGGSISEFGECVEDIAGAIECVRRFSSKIVLQGHSLGCDRIVHYQLCSYDWYDTVLLAPCDSYRLHQVFLRTESVEEQIARLKQTYSMESFELLPSKEYGIQNRGERYRIPVTLRTFISIAEGPPFRLFRLDRPMDYLVQSRGFAAIGKRDDLQTAEPTIMFNHLA